MSRERVSACRCGSACDHRVATGEEGAGRLHAHGDTDRERLARAALSCPSSTEGDPAKHGEFVRAEGGGGYLSSDLALYRAGVGLSLSDEGLGDVRGVDALLPGV